MPKKPPVDNPQDSTASIQLPDRSEVINRREEYWVGDVTRKRLIQDLYKLATEPLRKRNTSIAINTSFGNGATSLAKRFIQQYPPTTTSQYTQVYGIFLSMTGIPDVKMLADRLVELILPEKVKLKDLGSESPFQRLQRFVTMAHKIKLGIVFLDNFQDCIRLDDTTRVGGEPFLKTMRQLIESGIHVVPVGSEKLQSLLVNDGALISLLNFTRGYLPPISEAGDIKTIMMDISKLKKEQIQDDAVIYVKETTNGIIGKMLDLIEQTFIETGNLSKASLQETRKLFDH